MKKFVQFFLLLMIITCLSLGIVGVWYEKTISKDVFSSPRDEKENFYRIKFIDSINDRKYYYDIFVTNDWVVRYYSFEYDDDLNEEEFIKRQENPIYENGMELTDQYISILKKYFGEVQYEYKVKDSVELTEKSFVLVDYEKNRAALINRDNINLNAILMAVSSSNTTYLDYLLRDNNLDEIIKKLNLNSYEKIDLDSELLKKLYDIIRYINVDVFKNDYTKDELIINNIISLTLLEKYDEIEKDYYVELNDENYKGVYEYTGQIEEYVKNCNMCTDASSYFSIIKKSSLDKIIKENYTSNLKYDITKFDYQYSSDCEQFNYDKKYDGLLKRGSTGCGLPDVLSNSIEYAYKNNDKIILIGKTLLVPAEYRSTFSGYIYNNVEELLPLFKYSVDANFYRKTLENDTLKSGVYDKFVTYYSFEFSKEIGDNYYLSGIEKLN